MILDILQTKTNFHMEWIARSRSGEPVSTADSPFEKGRLRVQLSYAGSPESEVLYYDPADTTWGDSLTDRFSFKLLEQDDCVGLIRGKTEKTGFLRAYAYYGMACCDRTFLACEVGLGKDGLFLCVYDGDKLVAIIEKTLKTVNYHDVYTAYIEDAAYVKVVMRFAVYYDITMLGDQMEIAVSQVTRTRKNTLQKEVLEKYDPAFIQRIKERDGAN